MSAKILVADDDGFIRTILRTMLEDYEVIEAEDGASALRLFRERRPDLVLMDTVMPDMDGIEATKEILSIDPQAVVLMITAFATTRRNEILDAGVREVISKPIGMDDLIGKLEKYLS